MTFPAQVRIGERFYKPFTKPTDAPSYTTIVYTMGYGDQKAIDLLGLTTQYMNPKSNFCHFDGWSQKGDWGAVTQFWKNVDYNFLMDIQKNRTTPVENWLIGDEDTSPPSRPLWIRNSELRCGHSVFSFAPVLVEADARGAPVEYSFQASYPTDRVARTIVFYNAIGMPKSMIPVIIDEKKKGVNIYQKYPYWIQRCSEVQWDSVNKRDKILWYPKGVEIYYVFFSKRDWATNTDTERMYIPKDCVTKTPNPNYPGYTGK
jgi:hypothetical protein